MKYKNNIINIIQNLTDYVMINDGMGFKVKIPTILIRQSDGEILK